MSVLNEIVAFLAAAPQSLGVPGTDLFVGKLPNTPNACGVVYEYPGAEPEFGFGQAGVKWERPAIQVVFRGEPDHDEEYSGPRAKAEAAYRALAAVETQVLSAGPVGTSAFYHHIHPQQSPFLLDRDDKGRVLIACNFLVEKEPSA